MLSFVLKNIEIYYKINLNATDVQYFLLEALKDTLNFELVGPYDVFTGKLINCDESNIMSYHLYWRYYYDPPEFQTILRSCDSNFHIGYFRYWF